MSPDLTFDLVLATVRRTHEPRRLLESLALQRGVRLIVVDQNPDGRLEDVIGEFVDAFPIVHLRSGPGLSRARNAALHHLAGGLVAFPDDDCWYPPGLLERVAGLFGEHPDWDGLSGRSVDEQLRSSVTRWDARSGEITPLNVWRRANSVTIFLRRSLVERTGTFDEAIGSGAGTEFGAAEEIDYLLRALAAGARLRYEPDVLVHHPRRREQVKELGPDLDTGYRYAMGMGRVLAKNGTPARRIAYHVARGYGGAVLSLLRARPRQARFYWAVGKGRLRGWRSARTAS